MILDRLKYIARGYLGQPVRRAVITVPAYFNDAQRAATKEAGRMADIDVLRVVNEPTAAALAYRLDETNQTEPEIYIFGLDKTSYEGQVLVYDLGAKTVDISIISIEEGVFEVRSTAGDSHIGGESFNDRVMIDMAEKYSKDYNVDITKDPTTMRKLRGEVDAAKKHLSSQESTTISIEYNGQNISESLTRAQFEALNGDLLQKTSQYVRQALGDAKMKTSEIDHIILAGGSSHIVKVQQMLEHLFEKTPRNEIDPEDVVAIGAAIQGSYLADSDRDYGCYFGETSFTSLGVEAPSGVMVPLVKRGTTLPTKKIHTFSTSANNQSVFPIRVYEGERARTEDNHKLAEFQLDIPQVTTSLLAGDYTLTSITD
jgi:heat shock protein 5